MHISEGKKIDIVAPAGGATKDIPLLYGNLVVVPNLSGTAGAVISARYTGHFDGPIKAGDTPAFLGEFAYFDEGEFTKTQPQGAGKVTASVGVFNDGGVLLTGELVTPEAAA
ncbi:hypothetical protein [Photobacterium sp. TLY01]|uniref:hypothetical protein n=1 Tax=Photobacterium sp. TLY01 TaxID=2907534 RepID=UPI001F30F997|nr:hypothetical protein [Photobacterium sp. TLY01]UIP28885.1 hypothetical protein LN341_05235 [Photobacterium sp. TLY01]